MSETTLKVNLSLDKEIARLNAIRERIDWAVANEKLSPTLMRFIKPLKDKINLQITVLKGEKKGLFINEEFTLFKFRISLLMTQVPARYKKLSIEDKEKADKILLG